MFVIVAPTMFAVVTFAEDVLMLAMFPDTMLANPELMNWMFAVLIRAVLPTLTPTPGFVKVHAALDETCGPSVRLLATAIIAATAVMS